MRLRHACISFAIVVLGGVLLGAPAQAAFRQGGKAAAPAVSESKGQRADEASGLSPRSPSTALPSYDKSTIEQRWGVRVQGMYLTAGGYMLDFRYAVTDAAKAAPLFDRRTKPVLIDEETGAVMSVPVAPKVGALRSSNDAKEGRTYSVFFANPRQFVPRFRRVTVTIGDFAVSGLTVR